MGRDQLRRLASHLEQQTVVEEEVASTIGRRLDDHLTRACYPPNPHGLLE